ncbi:MAG TPA: transporter [Verrucomicrobiae bacterium]|nr:transporter [Verrucomicrobiae bacterium]
MKKLVLVLVAVSAPIFTVAQAADIGHYYGGVMNIRDFFPPEQPGFYGSLYNSYYTTDRLNDRNGDKISSVEVRTPSGPVKLGLEVNLNIYQPLPAITWISPCEIFGARYGAFIAPSFANSSLETEFTIAERVAGRIRSSSLGVGDLFVQPVWLDWTERHWDFSLGYGFCAPTGKYDSQTVVLPGGADVTVESKNNIGLGFWTQQVQGGIAWYPKTNKATAFVAVLTYEYNGKKEDFELKPGQMLTLNWGISQYLPLCKNHTLLLEICPAGYDTWQITDSTGGDAIAPDSRSQVHGVGGEVGLTYVPWQAFLTLHGFYEYAAESRFQGTFLGINLGIKF